jgi:hypothetical protein
VILFFHLVIKVKEVNDAAAAAAGEGKTKLLRVRGAKVMYRRGFSYFKVERQLESYENESDTDFTRRSSIISAAR